MHSLFVYMRTFAMVYNNKLHVRTARMLARMSISNTHLDVYVMHVSIFTVFAYTLLMFYNFAHDEFLFASPLSLLLLW